MTERSLRNCRVLVVEDEFILADELGAELADSGAVILGPVATLEDACDVIRSERRIDGAVLDVNVGGKKTYSAADLLIERGVPFVFMTGYGTSGIPSRFSDVVRCEKPFNMGQITRAIGRAIHA